MGYPAYQKHSVEGSPLEITERNTEKARHLFEELGGTVNDGFPAIDSPVHHTKVGTPYLKKPGVVVLARPQTNVRGLAGFLEGISRSVTHELVRHRAGVGVSQTSQRYVAGSVLRFVERPEYQEDEELHRLFEERADRAATEYEAMAERLLERQEGGASMLSADFRTDARKKVQQTARSLLPNETEAPMVFTGNVRALRHIIEMRA